MTKISSKSIVPATENQKIPVSPDNVISPGKIREFVHAPITVDYLTLAQLGADSEVIEGQVYKYVDATFLPASIGHILLTGSGTQTYNNIGQAYVTAIGKYVQCDYDLATNKIVCVLEQEFLIIDNGTSFTVTPLKDDFVGITYTLNLSGVGLTPYIITASSSIWDAAKTKVVGYYGIDVNNDPIYSFGEYIGGTTISVEVFNAYSAAPSGHEKQDSITFKVITTL